MISHRIFAEFRKDAARKPDTEELLYIEQHILNEGKTRLKNLAMEWMDNKKAYDMVPLSWILHYVKMYKIPDQVIQFIEKTMQTWVLDLTAEGKGLAEEKIQRGKFQADKLPPLLFVVAMMPLNHIIRKCTDGNKINKS